MAEMIKHNSYSINCGGSDFYQAKSGQLFFPDRRYVLGGYGYDGGYQSIDRSIQGLTHCDDPTLFATEAYTIDAYRFTLKPGKYTVRLCFKVGYMPGARPGVFVQNVDIENKRVLTNYDIFVACGNDFNKAAIPEFKGVEVKDGILDIEFSVPEGISLGQNV
jgi:hypothetical protein